MTNTLVKHASKYVVQSGVDKKSTLIGAAGTLIVLAGAFGVAAAANAGDKPEPEPSATATPTPSQTVTGTPAEEPINTQPANAPTPAEPAPAPAAVEPAPPAVEPAPVEQPAYVPPAAPQPVLPGLPPTGPVQTNPDAPTVSGNADPNNEGSP